MERAKQVVKSDKADAILTTFVISLFFVLLTAGFALDVSKNYYIKNEFKTISQIAAEEGIKEIDSQGNLTAAAPARVVESYMRERNISDVGVFSSPRCAKVERGYQSVENGIISNKVKDVEVPYMIIKVSNRGRGGVATVSSVYVSENGADPRLISGPPISSGLKMNQITANIYDSAENFLLNVAQVTGEDYNLDCQYFNSSVSAVKFGSNEDL